MLTRETAFAGLLVASLAPMLAAQDAAPPQNAQVAAVLQRLERLEKQNQELQEEIRRLKQELAGLPTATPTSPSVVAPVPAPSVEERLDVAEARTAELAQAKLDTSQRMPVELTGMLLFNAYINGKNGNPNLQVPVTASLGRGQANTGATFRQTVLGLRFHGPALPGGGKAEGSFYMDFWGGVQNPSGNLFRIRLATVDLIWKNTTLTAGQDKPIVAPREPSTLSQVGLAPLTGAGNLWSWQPQVRIQQRFHFSENSGGKAEAGIFQTAEAAPTGAPAAIAATLERARPGWEARVNFWRGNEDRGVEIAPGIHYSTTHIAGQTAPSRLFTLDWNLKPAKFFTFDGAMFHGYNAAGLGSLRQGFTVLPSGRVIPVHTTGAWSQMTFFATPKLSFHLFGGMESNRAADLLNGNVRRNAIYASNLIYKLAPNVLAALEYSQNRTLYINNGVRLNNHYDLALAYLF